MAFESKRLRVQLPCGDTSVHEHEGRLVIPGPGTIRPTCTAVGSLTVNPTCGLQGSILCYWCTHTVTGTLCGAIGSLDYERRPEEDPTLVVEADQLPVIRAQLELQLKQLEEQLKEVEVAEAAVAEREAGD